MLLRFERYVPVVVVSEFTADKQRTILATEQFLHILKFKNVTEKYLTYTYMRGDAPVDNAPHPPQSINNYQPLTTAIGWSPIVEDTCSRFRVQHIVKWIKAIASFVVGTRQATAAQESKKGQRSANESKTVETTKENRPHPARIQMWKTAAKYTNK